MHNEKAKQQSEIESIIGDINMQIDSHERSPDQCFRPEDLQCGRGISLAAGSVVLFSRIDGFESEL